MADGVGKGEKIQYDRWVVGDDGRAHQIPVKFDLRCMTVKARCGKEIPTALARRAVVEGALKIGQPKCGPCDLLELKESLPPVIHRRRP